MLIGTAVCGKPHVRWCERAGEIKTSPPYSISMKLTLFNYRHFLSRILPDNSCTTYVPVPAFLLSLPDRLPRQE